MNQKYAYAQREAHLLKSIETLDPDIILEKYAILSYLMDNSPRTFLQNNQNPFSQTIFKSVLSDLDALIPLFFNHLAFYQKEIHQYQNQQIKQLNKNNVGGRYDLLSFTDQCHKMSKFNENFEYKFQIGLKSRQKNMILLSSLLFNKALEIIEER